jgi:hypothetical protein
MSKPLLVVGLSDKANVEDASRVAGQIRANYPQIDVLVIAGCVSIAVVESGDE